MKRALIAVLLVLAVGCTREPPPLPEGYKSPPEPTSTYLGPVGVEQISVIGDSYTSGTRMGGRGDMGWPVLTEKQLRKQGVQSNVKVAAEGGSGYVARGEHGLTFADEIPKVVAPKDDLVVVLGSSNDGRNIPLDVLRPAVQSTLAEVRASAPEAKLLVVGPFYTAADAPPELLAVRDVVRDQAVGLGAQFVDPIGEGWFVDRPELISSDGAHPTDEGHVYLAEKLAPIIAAQIDPPA